jgi:hypothetical protein
LKLHPRYAPEGMAEFGDVLGKPASLSVAFDISCRMHSFSARQRRFLDKFCQLRVRFDMRHRPIKSSREFGVRPPAYQMPTGMIKRHGQTKIIARWKPPDSSHPFGASYRR